MLMKLLRSFLKWFESNREEKIKSIVQDLMKLAGERAELRKQQHQFLQAIEANRLGSEGYSKYYSAVERLGPLTHQIDILFDRLRALQLSLEEMKAIESAMFDLE